MNNPRLSFKLAAALALALGTFTGCESTDGGGTYSTTTVYYGAGFYDPWYHGDDDYHYDIDVSPPDRPGSGARPSHPIARPPGDSRPSVSPRPSIPSSPRPAARPASRPSRRR